MPGTGLIGLNREIIKRVNDERLTIDHLFILEAMYHEEYDILDYYDEGYTKERCLMNYQNLERKEFIVPDTNTSYYIISVTGKEFYEELLSLSKGIKAANYKTNSVIKDKRFDEWWETYPSTASWTTDDGKKFMSGRSLRSGSKEENRKAYLRVLNEGRYTHEELVSCLKYEIAAKKKQSVDTNSNHLQFMKGSLAYLNQSTFENFIELVRSGDSIDESTTNWELA